MKQINIEIKAKCKDHNRIRKILKLRHVIVKGTDHQVDTYFKVNRGRLKLREGRIENALIFYERENKEGPKRSDIILHKSSLGPSLKEILTKALGVLTVVDKEREIYFIDNVKFHLDTVKNLGTFVEIEAIDEDGTIGRRKLREQCEHYLALFAIKPEDLFSGSYSDMLPVKRTIAEARKPNPLKSLVGIEESRTGQVGII